MGAGWIQDLDKLRRLEVLADDAEFHDEWRAVKQHNKMELARYISEELGVDVDPIRCSTCW